MSIWTKWLDAFEWTFDFKWMKDRTPEELDKASKEFLDAELQTAINELVKIERLRKTPQVFRQRWEALQAAEKFRTTYHSAVNRLQKYSGDYLTPEEKKDRQRWLDSLTKRENCKHMKGPVSCRWGVDTYGGPRHGGFKDYNLAKHTFVDGRTKIWCLWNCGYVVWSDGDKAAYAVANERMSQSINRESASERFMISKDGGKNYVVVCGDVIPEVKNEQS